MRPYYLLDTNIICEGAKKIPDEKVMAKLRKYASVSAVSSITVAEIWKGIQLLPDGHRRDKYMNFFENELRPLYPQIPFDEHSALIYGECEAEEEKKGRPRPQLDLLIAATAIANNMILVTRNTADFEDIPGLMMENWFEES